VSAAREQVGRYRDDPVGFMRDVLGFTPWSVQRQIAEAVRDHDRVAVKAANATGKTAVAAAIVIWWLSKGPGSIVISTSATERQLRKVLWREIAQRHRAARGLLHGAVVTDTEISLGPDWYALGLASDQAEALQGHHAARVLVVVDEASGVEEEMFGAIEGLLAGGETKLLLLGNPLRTSGTFFDSFGKDAADWELITISAFDTPNFTGERVPRAVARQLVSRKWVERAAKRGEGSNEYLIRCLGEFPTEAEDTVISLGDLQTAQQQNFEPELPLVIGVDCARFGSDATVLAIREGCRIRVAKSYHGKDLMETSGHVTELARKLEAAHGRKPTIVVDDTGLGGGLTDRLRELGEFKIVAFTAGRKASRPREYPNKRSELWFAFAELLPVLDIDVNDHELASDLLAPTFSLSSSAQRVVEPKSNTRKRLRRSPDRADAVMLTCVVDPPARPGRPAARGGSVANPNTMVTRRLDGRSRPQPTATGRMRVRAELARGRSLFASQGQRDPTLERLSSLGVDVYGNGGYIPTSHPDRREPAPQLEFGTHDADRELRGYTARAGASLSGSDLSAFEALRQRASGSKKR
jgi:phage terminase large subunit